MIKDEATKVEPSINTRCFLFFFSKYRDVRIKIDNTKSIIPATPIAKGSKITPNTVMERVITTIYFTNFDNLLFHDRYYLLFAYYNTCANTIQRTSPHHTQLWRLPAISEVITQQSKPQKAQNRVSADQRL